MDWITNRLFGGKKSQDAELAENMYSALVLDGGPSAASSKRIDATELEIPLGKLEQFAQKRLISLEAMLFVASQIETVERSEKLQKIFGDRQLHPFAMEVGRLIHSKWKQRGIEIEKLDVSERCFDEIGDFLDKPFRWARAWLDEFYEDSDKSGEHYIMWTEQWLKEFEVMRDMVKKFT
jgi:hypothetical protein